MSISRRKFVQGAAATAAAFTLMPTKVRGANDQIRVAVCGVHSRGRTHVDYVSDCRESHHANVVALCDVDAHVLADRVQWAKKDYKFDCEPFADFRRALDRKDIDVITIATPNHWHSLLAILAIQAGKDVYVEKPVCHNVWEGRQLVNAARKYGRIVQTGTQCRSMHGMQKMIEYIHTGQLGKVKYAIGTCYKPRMSIGKRSTPLDIPDYINYDLWCGPAQKVPLYRNQLHYDWHWDFNTGNGDLGNQGIHQMDLARWFTQHDELSPRVMSIGGRLGYDDAGNTANEQVVFHDYPERPVIFEVRGLPIKKDKFEKGKWGPADMERGPKNVGNIGVLVVCEHGYLAVNSYSSGSSFDNDGKHLHSFSGGGNHMGNFLDAVRSRKYTELNADILQGHISSSLCHTGNISYRLGKKAKAPEIADRIKSDPVQADSFGRMAEQLRTIGLPIDNDPLLAEGPILEMNPQTERFVGNDDANALLKDKYRPGFVVPEIGA